MYSHKLLLSVVIGLGALIILTAGALVYGFAKRSETNDSNLLERSNKEITTLPANININLADNEKLLNVTQQHDKIILLIGDKDIHRIMVFSLENAQKIAVFNLK